jgi:hypothetical protein
MTMSNIRILSFPENLLFRISIIAITGNKRPRINTTGIINRKKSSSIFLVV